MVTITLTNEQEKFLEEQIKTGKYKNYQELISKAFEALVKQEKSQEILEIRGSESAQKLLNQKLEQLSRERVNNPNQTSDPQRQELAQEFTQLCKETQALHADRPLTDAEIQEEINAYRRGE